MSLPSQSSRNATRSSQVHYRRSRANPLKRILTIVVIIAIIILVWFTLIRPRASKITTEQPQTNAASQNTTPNSAGDNNSIASNFSSPNSSSTTPPSNQPTQSPAIINNSPSRPLPGAGNRPDTRAEVDRVIGSTPNDTNTNPSTSNAKADILSAAAEQAANNTTQPQSQPTNQPVSQPQTQTNSSSSIRLHLETADRLIAENDRVQARALLSQTLLNADLSSSDIQILRDKLTGINNTLLFSPVVDPKDPMSENYKVQSGDSLSRIAGRRELATHWKLISRINKIADPSKIRLDQNLKLVRGPFHAIVNKAAHRLDVYHGSPTDPKSWLYIRSFDVGLGSNDGTPVGEFVVSANKLENPGWVNPRDAREQYTPDDPKNPIGEFWIGLTGVGKYESLTSLGIHGTIDPSSIGSNESMGCVRLADEDIAIVYELLAEHISRVLIVP